MMRYHGQSSEVCMRAVGRLLDVGDIPSRVRVPADYLVKMLRDPANHRELAGIAREVEEACTELLERVEDLHDVLYRAMERVRNQAAPPESSVAADGGAG